jgi:hypothetical protein
LRRLVRRLLVNVTERTSMATSPLVWSHQATRGDVMKKALLAGIVTVAFAAPGTATATAASDPGCFGAYHALAAQVLGGAGEMIRSNCVVRRGNDGQNLGQDFNPYLRDAVC